MPAGLPYFAWIDPGETVFGVEHLRWDESIFSFALSQSEGDPAALTLVVRGPRIGLLGPGKKFWCWFALDCGPDLIRFRGRLVGVPTSIFEQLVTLEFVARPTDIVAQKAALAETLKVLPYYDEVVIDKDRRDDPDVVLEGYSAIWHYDRETHELTVSDEITGEDGLVEFDGASEGGKVLYDGLGLTLTSGPLARVDVAAEYVWTQQAKGRVDLTRYLIRNWPESGPNYIRSFSLTAADWPKTGTGIGDGWTVAEATAWETYDLTVKSTTKNETQKTVFPDTSWFGASTTTQTSNETISHTGAPAGSLTYPEIVTNDEMTVQQSSLEDPANYSRNYAGTAAVLPMHYVTATLHAGYAANRQVTERVSFSLFADVQSILTDPEDGEALRVDDIKSVNLSETIGEGSDAYMPIGDPARRSYIATERGNRSIEHLIALARAHLLKRARVVEIACVPKLARMPEITLRKNAFLVEPRIGEALGKIIGYSVSLDGADGHVKCEIRIGCTIGRGGSAVAAGGEPTYAEEAYTGADYQVYTGRMVLFDASVGYEPPASNPNDDGINFLSALKAEDVIDTPLAVVNPPSVQGPIVYTAGLWGSVRVSGADIKEQEKVVAARAQAVNDALTANATKATFKLKSMTRAFTSDYELRVTDLSVPTGYDLEATA